MEFTVDLSIRLLVVDDDEVVCDLIAEQLAEHATSVEKALSVAEALESSKSRAPDLVLSEIRMSPEDGYTLLVAIRRSTPEIPVVLMSSFSPQGSIERARAAGAAGFLRKPFTQGELFGALASALHAQAHAPT